MLVLLNMAVSVKRGDAAYIFVIKYFYIAQPPKPPS